MSMRSGCVMVVVIIILCCVGGTVSNVPVHRVSTDRNGSKTGTHRIRYVLDDVGIWVKMGF